MTAAWCGQRRYIEVTRRTQPDRGRLQRRRQVLRRGQRREHAHYRQPRTVHPGHLTDELFKVRQFIAHIERHQ
jgi:hypothetical protein